ncbi:MAG: ankyrin repeat-containing protein [Chthonomonadaceae bacterium]|jgi:ankyrin repeat protein|nr:ankyrin repeat-containing protein [Chthonomonadaceae bacterium]
MFLCVETSSRVKSFKAGPVRQGENNIYNVTKRRLNLLSLEEGNRSLLPCLHKKDGQTPLMQAAQAGHLPLVRLLLARGDNVNASDRFGATALMRACKHGHQAVAYLLIARGANVTAKTKPSGFTPLLMAIHSLEQQDRSEARLVSRGSPRLLRMLILKGADVNARDAFGNSILSYAVIHGRKDAVRLLLAHGANVDSQTRIGYTALIIAVGYGSLALVHLLLAAGADPALRTRNGHSALFFARKRKRSEIVKALVAAGARE